MSDSILISTKKALDLPENYDVFDQNIIMHINGVFSTLTQLGIGPDDGFEIADDTSTWSHFLAGNAKFNFVKTYMYLRVRMIFDPPATSYLIEAMNKQKEELEWRINAEQETRSTRLKAAFKRITGNRGDEIRVQMTNPVGKTHIDATGSYEAVFAPLNGSRERSATLDTTQSASGILYLMAVIEDGTYTVRRLNPRRTILVLEVNAE